MTKVRGSRTYPAPASAVQTIIDRDVQSFIGAGGFDTVTKTGDRITVTRNLGLATIELTVLVDRGSNGVLRLEAIDGIFDRMETEYSVESTTSGSRVTAWTTFSLGGVFGRALDATLVTTQRKREFEEQFDYLESQLAVDGITP